MEESKAAPAGSDAAGADGVTDSSEKSDKKMCPALSEIPPRLGDDMQEKRAAFGNAERHLRREIARKRGRAFNKR